MHGGERRRTRGEDGGVPPPALAPGPVRRVIPTGRLHRAEWALAIAGSALTATLILLGDFLDDATADDLVPVLVSLQRWTAYYWQQDRYGMLTPLLAVPVQAPFANLLFQSGLCLFAAVMALVLGPRVVSHRPGALLAGVITATLFVATASRELLHDLGALAQPYGAGLALTFAGLIAVDGAAVARGRSARRALGTALLSLGLFVNIALVVVIVPFVALRALPQVAALRRARRPLRTWWREPALFPLGALAFAVLANVVSAKTSPSGGATRAALAPVETWPQAWAAFFTHTAAALPPSWLLVLGMATGALIVFIAIPSPRGITRDELVSAGLALGVAAAAWVFTGTLYWLSINDYLVRYAVPSLVFAFVGVVGFAFTRITVAPQLRLAVMVVCFAVLVTAVRQQYGAPSLARLRASLDRFGPGTATLLRLEATHLAGNYWTVWPAVFHAALVRSEQDLPGALYGVSFRSGPTMKLWRNWPVERIRVAVREGDGDAARWLRDAKLGPLAATEQADGYTIYRVALDR